MSNPAVPENPQEAGFAFDPPELANLVLPPGMGKMGVPHISRFASIVNLASRSYRWTSDEAVRHSEQNSRAVQREPVIWEAIRARQYPTVQMPWHISPLNNKNPREEQAAYEVEEFIKRTYRFQQFKRQHMDAIWFGKSAANVAWEWDFKTGKKGLRVRDWAPIRGDKIVYKFSGQLGIRTWGAFKAEDNQLLGKVEVTDRGMAYFVPQAERPTYVVHSFEPEDADYMEPELAGAVKGSGIRGRIYWLWHIRTQVLAWMLDYLELVGAGGFTIAYYQAGNKASLDEVEGAMSRQLRNHIILFPRHANKDTLGPGLERVEAGTAGANLLKELITEYFDSVIRRYIMGPYLSSEVNSAGMGLGEGTSDLLVGPFARIVKYDCTDLADSYTEEWVPTFYRALYPNLPPGQFEFDIDTPNAAELAEAAKVFYEMGGDIDAEHMRDALGLPEPDPDGGVLAKAQPMSVQGVDPNQPVPAGVPSEGTPGPVAQGPVASPNGEPISLQRLRLSRRGRDAWWKTKTLGQKLDVLSRVVGDLVIRKDRRSNEPEGAATRANSLGVDLHPTFNITTPPVTVEVGPPTVTVESPTVHVEAPQVSVGSPTVQVESPTVYVASPQVTVGAPQVKVDVAAPQVHVPAPQISVAAPQVHVAAPQVDISVNPELKFPPFAAPELGERRIEVERDRHGNMTSAKLIKE
jgi:hypothetical protein